MKKISLKNLNLKEVEQLSREQLRNVLGGWSDGSGTNEVEATNHSCSCSGTRVCSVSHENNPTPEEVAAACEKCCNE